MRPTPDTLVAQKLGDEPLALFGADAYLHRRGAPRDPTDLVGHDVVVYADRHPAAQWCATAYRNATVVLSCRSMQVTAAAMAAGVGLGVIPFRAARIHPGLRAVSSVVARGTGWLVVHPDLRHVPRIRAVVDALASIFRADPIAT
jgi:DNA-binding transcriptional LysR family regulator